MTFLFDVTVLYDGIDSHYKVYEFPILPGVFKASIVRPSEGPTWVIFSKKDGKWKSELENTQELAEILGKEVDNFRKKQAPNG